MRRDTLRPLLETVLDTSDIASELIVTFMDPFSFPDPIEISTPTPLSPAGSDIPFHDRARVGSRTSAR